MHSLQACHHCQEPGKRQSLGCSHIQCQPLESSYGGMQKKTIKSGKSPELEGVGEGPNLQEGLL